MAVLSVSPMDIRPGDVFTDASSDWQVIGQPFCTGAGSTVHARVRPVSQPGLTDLLTWDAHERISVRRNLSAG
jgi:hypothetical protein